MNEIAYTKIVCRRDDGTFVKRWEDRSGPGSSSGIGFCATPINADEFDESCLGKPASYALCPYNNQRGYEDCKFVKVEIAANWRFLP